jgi:hypothetical protein
VKPNRGNRNGGLVGYGWYGRRNGVNAFRQWGNKGLLNYWWANDVGKYGLPIQNGRWHHIAATFDGWRRRVYFDFKPVAVRTNRNFDVRTKRNFCVGKTYGREYFRGWFSKVKIYPVARAGSLMREGMRSTPVVWLKGYRTFNRNRCLMRRQGARARLPSRRGPYTIEARIKPSRSTSFTGGIVGWGYYGRRSSTNAFRLAGRDGLFNYYWANDLYASPADLRRYGRRLHDGRYHHVATTFDGWYQRIFVDFRQVKARRSSGPVSLTYKNNFCIGKTYGREYFRGRMGEFKVYRWARGVRDMRKRGC